VETAIAARAMVYRTLSRVPVQAAIKQAYNDVMSNWVVVNGRYIDITNHPIAKASEFSKHVAPAIVKNYLASKGLPDNGSHSLFLTTNGTWGITDNPDVPMTVPDSPTYTDSDIEYAVKYIQERRFSDANKAAMMDMFERDIEQAYRFPFGNQVIGTSTRTDKISGELPEGAPAYQEPDLGTEGTPRFKREQKVGDKPQSVINLETRRDQIMARKFVARSSPNPNMQSVIELLSPTPQNPNKPIKPTRDEIFRKRKGGEY
jgi:hypothetical protein